MELHGKNPSKNIIAIIPARYASARLPGKMLLDIAGKPLVLHTLGQVGKARNVTRVIVATDDDRIFRVVTESGGEALMTSADHKSGSDRLAEAARDLPDDAIIVNVQGDEPTISPLTIEIAVDALLGDDNADMSTTRERIRCKEDLFNGNNVKVVTSDVGYALYFSRSPVPFPREAALRYNGDLGLAIESEPNLLSLFRKHTGLYVYRRSYLLKFAKMPLSRLERIEMLEQLRALENGAKIRVAEVDDESIGVDTSEDLERARHSIEAWTS